MATGCIKQTKIKRQELRSFSLCRHFLFSLLTFHWAHKGRLLSNQLFFQEIKYFLNFW